jgi:hypothetical protein
MRRTLVLLGKIGGAIVGAVIGFVLGSHAGINLLLPAVVAAIVFWVALKTAPLSFQPMALAFAVQAGQVLWMIAGLIYLQRVDVSAVDVLIILAGLGWLLFRPGLPPVIFLTLFQLVALGINLYSFDAVPEDSPEEKALAAHILLRILSIVLMIGGLRLLRKSPENATSG